MVVVEGTLLLQLKPLLLEDVQGLRHSELLQEVPDEIVDHDLLFEYFGFSLGLVSPHGSDIAGTAHPRL